MVDKDKSREKIHKARLRVAQEAHRSGHEIVTGGMAIYVFDHIGKTEGIVPLVIHWISVLAH